MARNLLLAVLGLSVYFLYLDGSTALQDTEIVSSIPPTDLSDPNIVGDFSPVDPIDPEVVAIGKFVVDTYNEDTEPILVFEKVVTAERQVVEGTNYNIIITAKDGDILSDYRALVWVNHKGIKFLLSFEGPL